MTAPRRSGAEQATMRGIIVLVVAVVIGVGLLSKSDAIVGSAEASNGKPDSTTTTTLDPAVTTTSLPPGTGAPVNTGETVAGARPPAEVKVIVINAAGGIAGVGSANSELLTTAGYNVINIKNATAAPTTTIYFAEGFQADAEAVKAALTTTAAVVAPNPAEPIIPEAAEANVSVVIGQDYTPPA